VCKLARRSKLQRQIFLVLKLVSTASASTEAAPTPCQDRDLLLFAVFLQHKVLFLQIRHRSPAPILTVTNTFTSFTSILKWFPFLGQQPGTGKRNQQ